MKNLWVLAFLFLSLTVQAQRFNTIVLSIKTGNDDLREGNDAWIRFLKLDGTMTPEKNFADIGRRDGAFKQNVDYTMEVGLGATIDLKDVSGFVIRHDGTPRALNPFDTYDNWNVVSVKIAVKLPDGNRNIYDSSLRNTFFVRFTGEKRTMGISRNSFLPDAFKTEEKSDKIELQPTQAKPEAPKVIHQSTKIELHPTTAKPEVKQAAQQPAKIELKPTMAKPEAPKVIKNK